MLAILPLMSLLLLFLIWHKSNQDWRLTYLSSIVILGSLIALSSETFSLIQAINFPTILSFWILVNLVLGGYYYYLLRQGNRVLPSLSLPKLTIVSSLILGGIGFIVVLVGLVAVIAPPNNWDSMTYHMARVMHWIQNQNLAHYPTYYSAQLVHPPLAEIGIMHLQILSGSDRFANLIQWFAMVSSIIGVSLIAKQLGAKQEGQLLASVFCATLPMGILQGSSTQNDYAVALWIVCLAYFTLVLISSSHISKSVALAIASSLGLALLTKSSAYFFGFPFIVWAAGWLWSIKKWKSWKYLFMIISIALLFNWAQYLRNIEVFGSPISAAEYKEENQVSIYSVPTFVSTIIRNLSIHTDIVRYFHLQNWLTPITGKVEKIVYIIHQNILKIDPSNPKITMPGYTFKVPGLSFNEDVAVNPFHYFLILLAIGIFIFNWKLRSNHIIRNYLISLLGAFLLLSLFLKIQPYSVRHHLTLFILFSPFVGLCFSRTIQSNSLKILTFVLIITCIPWLFNNNLRPLVGENSILTLPRNDVYFTGRKWLKGPYYEATQFVAKQDCTNIGLSLGWNSKETGAIWEYPLWPLMSEADPKNHYRFSHIVSPDNPSAKLMDKFPYDQDNYCALIAVRTKEDDAAEQFEVKNTLFTKTWSRSPVNILLPTKQ